MSIQVTEDEVKKYREIEQKIKNRAIEVYNRNYNEVQIPTKTNDWDTNTLVHECMTNPENVHLQFDDSVSWIYLTTHVLDSYREYNYISEGFSTELLWDEDKLNEVIKNSIDAYNKRIEDEKILKAQKNQLKQEKIEAKERAEYERLKAKFEGK